jgi:outer membrane protein TolC
MRTHTLLNCYVFFFLACAALVSFQALCEVDGSGTKVPVLTLSEVLALAKDQNQDVRVLLSKIEQAKARFEQARSLYLPHLSINGSYTRNSVPGKFALPKSYVIRQVDAPTSGGPNNPRQPLGPSNLEGSPTNFKVVPEDFAIIQVQKTDQLDLKALLTQTIFSADQLIAVIAGDLGKKVTILQTRQGIQSVLFEVARTYLLIVQLKERVNVQAEFVKAKAKHEADARLAFSVGSQPKIELLRAEIELSKANNDLILARNALNLAKTGLGRLIDKEESFDVEMPAVDVSSVEARGEDALKIRLDYKAALLGSQVAKKSFGLSFAKYIPNLEAFGQYQISNNVGFTGRNDSLSGGFSLRWNLFDGFNREGQLHEYRAQTLEAAAAVRSVQLKVLQDVDEAKVAIDNAHVSLQNAKEQVALAKENSRLVMVRYEAKAATYLDLIDADTTLKAAQMGEVAAGVEGVIANLQLQKATGTFAEGLF